VKILVENLVVQWVVVSLLESHVHDSTKNFEEVLGELLWNLTCWNEFDVKFVFSLFYLWSDLRGVNKAEIDKDIDDVCLQSPVGLEFDVFDNFRKSHVKVSQFSGVLLLNLNKGHVWFVEIVSFRVNDRAISFIVELLLLHVLVGPSLGIV
jgi:hypothetical protein